MKSIKKIWEETALQLESIYPKEESKNIAKVLFEDVFEVTSMQLIADEQIMIDPERLQACVDRLLQHEPIQYVTGICHFYGREFGIKAGALIPRPETEELVHRIIQQNTISNPRVLDVATGSGCIAMTLELELKGTVYATDVSEEALAIATKNAQKLNAETTFISHDILNDDLELNELDILVSNPPYIPENEQKTLRQNVAFEPAEALFVPDNQPIIFYEKIAEAGIKALNEEGKLYFEIHEQFARQIHTMLELSGYREVQVLKDMQGKNRFIQATNSTNR